MRTIYTGLAVWNLLVLGTFAVLGLFRAADAGLDFRSFQILGLFSAFFCCLVQSLLVVHFIGSMKWIQQSGPTAGIEDTKPLRTAWIKGPAFPLITLAMLGAVAAAILSGAAETGAVPHWVFLTVAFLNLPLNVAALAFARRAITSARERMIGVEAQMQARIASGAVAREEASEELLEESGAAAGKVFVFLAVNVWVLYVYFRFVMRDASEPWWPYAVASAVMGIVGIAMLRRDAACAREPGSWRGD
jgi:hypothetical protein